MNTELYRETATARRDTYAFLARMFREEVDQPLLVGLKQLSFGGLNDEDDFSQGMGLLASYLRQAGFDARTDLAVDYAQVFLGIGSRDGQAAHPYESVYTSSEHLMMQDAHDAMTSLLRLKNLERRPRGASGAEYLARALGANTEPADHVALEFDYMGWLIEEGFEAVCSGSSQEAMASVREQRAFLREHLLNWVPALCEDIEERTATDFYRGVARMAAAYLASDNELLEELSREE